MMPTRNAKHAAKIVDYVVFLFTLSSSQFRSLLHFPLLSSCPLPSALFGLPTKKHRNQNVPKIIRVFAFFPSSFLLPPSVNLIISPFSLKFSFPFLCLLRREFSKKTSGTRKCPGSPECSGNGKCEVTGACTCNGQWTGPSCSESMKKRGIETKKK